jgi:hypothetical protein
MLACTQFKLYTRRISILLQQWNQWLNFLNDHIIDHNHKILFQILCEKNCSLILMMHFTNRWHVNKKNGIIFSLQVFIHMASMIDNKVTCMSKISFKNVTKIMSFHIWLQNDHANDMDKMNTKYDHKII